MGLDTARVRFGWFCPFRHGGQSFCRRADLVSFGYHLGENAGSEFQALPENTERVFTHFGACEEFGGGLGKVQPGLKPGSGEGVSHVMVTQQKTSIREGCFPAR